MDEGHLLVLDVKARLKRQDVRVEVVWHGEVGHVVQDAAELGGGLVADDLLLHLAQPLEGRDEAVGELVVGGGRSADEPQREQTVSTSSTSSSSSIICVM